MQFLRIISKKILFFCIYFKKECIFARHYSRRNINKKRIMKELVEKVAELYAAFEKDAKAQIENGNKAAGTRARKASLEIEKSMKACRKASLEAAK